MKAIRSTAKKIANRLKRNNGGVVLIDGVMGAGKTVLVSFIVKYLNKKIKPSSPTFSIINKYTENIYHADLYRLNGADPVNTGLYDLLTPQNYVFIEWAGDLDIQNAIRVKINVKEDGSREFIIAG
jgi:tRNA threonylcarbamoyladenosine biosynthesis protein TsaE